MACPSLSVSPLMQQLLGWDDSAGQKVQNMFRTVPISWCRAGGSETHRRRTIPKELHDSISVKAAANKHEFHKETRMGHKKRMKGQKEVEKKMNLMMAGPKSRISQYALDLIKAQREKQGDKKKKTDEDIEESIDLSKAFYNDESLDKFLEEFD